MIPSTESKNSEIENGAVSKGQQQQIGKYIQMAKQNLEESKRILGDAEHMAAERESLLASTKVCIFNRWWLKVTFWICTFIVFMLGGFAGVGAATLAYGHPLALSNTEALIQFVGTGWMFVWRAFIGLSTIVGIIQLSKWLLCKPSGK